VREAVESEISCSKGGTQSIETVGLGKAERIGRLEVDARTVALQITFTKKRMW
jgi:hypothetical protein